MVMAAYRLRVGASGPPARSWLTSRLSGMSSGNWLDVSTLTNVTAITDTTGPNLPAVNWLEGGEENYYATNWPGKMTSEADYISIIGTQQGHSVDPTGAYSKRISLSLSTGEFSTLWNPCVGAMGHCWDNNTSRELNGYIYRWQWNDLYRASVADRVFSLYLAAVGTAALVVPCDVHPNMGPAGSIVWLQSVSASEYSIKVLDISTSGVSTLGTTIATGSYPVVSYHEGIDSIIAGGSASAPYTLYKVSAGKVVTTLSTGAPSGVVRIGPDTNGAIFLPDPLGRTKAWLVDAITTGKIYELDLIAGTWSAGTAMPSFVSGGTYTVAGAVQGSSAIVVLSAGARSGGVSTSQAHIYKVA